MHARSIEIGRMVLGFALAGVGFVALAGTAQGCGATHESGGDSGLVARGDSAVDVQDSGALTADGALLHDGGVAAGDGGGRGTADSSLSWSDGGMSAIDSGATSVSEIGSLVVSVASVTLESDCRTSSDAAPGLWDCGANSLLFCGCTQSRVQLLLAAGDSGNYPKSFMITNVRVLARDRHELGVLVADDPEVFDGDQYIAWNEQVPSGHALQVRYALTAPDWSSIYETTDTDRYAALELWVEVTIVVDGVTRVLEYGPAMREPEIVT